MWASSPTESCKESGARPGGGQGRPPLWRGQEVRGRRDDVGIVPYGELQGVRYKAGRIVREAGPYTPHILNGNRAGRCGERIERRRWRKKGDERVAAVKISSVRRKAARKFWAPQQDHP